MTVIYTTILFLLISTIHPLNARGVWQRWTKRKIKEDHKIILLQNGKTRGIYWKTSISNKVGQAGYILHTRNRMDLYASLERKVSLKNDTPLRSLPKHIYYIFTVIVTHQMCEKIKKYFLHDCLLQEGEKINDIKWWLSYDSDKMCQIWSCGTNFTILR